MSLANAQAGIPPVDHIDFDASNWFAPGIGDPVERELPGKLESLWVCWQIQVLSRLEHDDGLVV